LIHFHNVSYWARTFGPKEYWRPIAFSVGGPLLTGAHLPETTKLPASKFERSRKKLKKEKDPPPIHSETLSTVSGEPSTAAAAAARWRRRSRRCAPPSRPCSTTPTTPPARSPTRSPAAPSISVGTTTTSRPGVSLDAVRVWGSYAHAVGVSDTAPACDAESAARGFLQGLERRSEAAGADLSRLESMAFGTVSFEELLGHCGEALAMFSRHADAIESRLVAFGYVPPDEEASEDVEEDWDVEKLPGVAGNGCFGGTSSVLRSSREMVDDDDALTPCH
ncbi:Os12g0623400, partial [Oryza sativa Japonica Group]